jgi:hypothetical protein
MLSGHETGRRTLTKPIMTSKTITITPGERRALISFLFLLLGTTLEPLVSYHLREAFQRISLKNHRYEEF